MSIASHFPRYRNTLGFETPGWTWFNMDIAGVYNDILVDLYVQLHGVNPDTTIANLVEHFTPEQRVYALLVMIEDCREYWHHNIDEMDIFIHTWIVRELLDSPRSVSRLFIKAWTEPLPCGNDTPQFVPSKHLLCDEWKSKNGISEANVVQINRNINYFDSRMDLMLRRRCQPAGLREFH